MAQKKNSPGKIASRCNASPWRSIDKLFTDDFIAKLAKDSKIQINQTKFKRIIRNIGRNYISVNRMPNLAEIRTTDRLKYLARQKDIAEFTEELGSWAVDDIAGDMGYAALSLQQPAPKTDFPDLTDHQRQRGEPYFHELLRLLGLAEKSQELVVQRLTSKGGRPINGGLEVLVRKAADFWIETLRRNFTIDHHPGSGHTEAFLFVRTLVQAIDNISDEVIVTAMRAEIKSRRLLGVPTRSLRPARAKRQS